jgi:ribA/ribD-fused uncharacterized protein
MFLATTKYDFLDSNGVVAPIITGGGIYGLFGQYRCLSNFHACSVTYDGLTYASSEAAYMAQKTLDPEVRQQFASLKTGKEAKALGKEIELRPDWDDVHRLHAMYRVLFAKFSQDHQSLSVLMSTGSSYIEESNWWNDRFWGKCNGVGLNHLGNILMTIRGFVSTQ